jgi:hypothetical protein
MSTVCDGGGVGMPVGIEASLDGRIANVNDAGGDKDDVTTGQEMRPAENGMKDAGGDTGAHYSSTYVGNCCAETPVTELNGISGKEITSNNSNRTRTTSDTWITEEIEDDSIVDFLDKSNDKVYLSLSHP